MASSGDPATLHDGRMVGVVPPEPVVQRANAGRRDGSGATCPWHTRRLQACGPFVRRLVGQMAAPAIS